jgi:hypothetical protein
MASSLSLQDLSESMSATPRSPRLPDSPYPQSTPEQEVYFSGEEEGNWSPSDVVELGSSSDDSPPRKKTLITHYFSKEAQPSTRSSQLPNFLKRYNPSPVQNKAGQFIHLQPMGASSSNESAVPSTGKT